MCPLWEETAENPCQHWENMQTPLRKTPVLLCMPWACLSRASVAYSLSLTSLCPKSLSMVASFFVLAYWRWATTAGLGSLQSTERRWSHISACCRWGCLRLGSKQWTSQPDWARELSRDRSSTPNLENTQKYRQGEYARVSSIYRNAYFIVLTSFVWNVPMTRWTDSSWDTWRLSGTSGPNYDILTKLYGN